MSVQTITAVVSAAVAVGALIYSISRDTKTDTREEENRLVKIEASLSELQQQVADFIGKTGPKDPPEEQGEIGPQGLKDKTGDIGSIGEEGEPGFAGNSIEYTVGSENGALGAEPLGKHRICAISGVGVNLATKGKTKLCRVSQRNDTWILEAQSEEGASLRCWARCL